MRLSRLLVLIASLPLFCGCSICAPGYLDDYAAVGGKWQRDDPANGRVGSIFSDPGFDADTSVVEPDMQYEEGYGTEGYEEEVYEEEVFQDGQLEFESDEDVSGRPLSLESRHENGVITLGDGW